MFRICNNFVIPCGLFVIAQIVLMGTLTVEAGTLIPVAPVSGSTSMFVAGINDSDVITGGYVTSDGKEHGYFGPLSGKSYQTFDVGKKGTEARGINNSNYVTIITN